VEDVLLLLSSYYSDFVGSQSIAVFICVGLFIVCLLSFIAPVKWKDVEKFWGAVALLFLFNEIKLV